MIALSAPDSRFLLLRVLGDEGLRLFFPLAALHAALWPTLWTAVHGLDLPFASRMPPSSWHAWEMIFGTYGAALIGFLTTAVPEWTDTARPRGRSLFILAGLWGTGRIAGFLGTDILGIVGGVADILWLGALVAYVAGTWARRRHTRLFGPLFWLSALAVSGAVVRLSFMLGDIGLAQRALLVSGLLFVGLLGLVLARIAIPVTNLVLDPTSQTSPYRPHPGRINLAPGLVFVTVCGIVAGLSPAVVGYLMIAAGAAFMDRISESFVGRETFRAEILVMAAASLLSGLGLMLAGASRLGAPFPETPALHLALMGGLGLGVLAVFSIAGLMHTGRTLPLPKAAPVSFLLAIAAVLLRALPDLGAIPEPPGPLHVVASLLWAAAFLVWLRTYWPFLSNPRFGVA